MNWFKPKPKPKPPDPGQLNAILSGLNQLTMQVVTLIRLVTDVQTKVTNLQQQGAKTMATLQDIQNAVAAETTVEQSAIALLQQISAELQAALASNDPVAMQAVVDMINTNASTLAAAVAANTPAAPPTP